MFTELFLKKLKSLFIKHAFHVMIKYHEKLSFLTPIESYFKIFEKIFSQGLYFI
jgi:hypothetical protein